jgi:hypothetical protein
MSKIWAGDKLYINSPTEELHLVEYIQRRELCANVCVVCILLVRLWRNVVAE